MKTLKSLANELGFTKGQVKLTIGFCIACGGIGWLGAMWAGFWTMIAFAVIALVWFISMFDISFKGIKNSELKHNGRKMIWRVESQDAKKPTSVN